MGFGSAGSESHSPHESGINSGNSNGLSVKNFPRVVSRVIGLSCGADSKSFSSQSHLSSAEDLAEKMRILQ